LSFDEQIRTALDRFVQELVRAAGEERARVAKEAAEAAATDVRRQAQTQLTQFREFAQRHADDLRRTADQQIDQLRRGLDEARAQVDAARAEVESARAEAQTARAQADEARRAADAEVADIRSTTDRRIAELAQEIINVRSSAAAEAEELLVTQLADAAGDNDRKREEALERAATDHLQTVLAQASRLADAVRSLDEGRGLGEVLDTLADSAAQEVDRAAVLVVKGERLRGWRLSGFGADAPSARTIELSLEEAGLPGAVVRTGVAVSRPSVEPDASAERQPALPPFAQDAGSRHALALPITVGGAVVAVLYADAPRLDAPSASSRWPAIVDVLTRHASRVLEAMTVQQAAGLSLPRRLGRASHPALPGPLETAAAGDDEESARRYARLLLSEIRMYNEPVVDAGRRARDLLSRLSGEIARARRLYEARIPPSVLGRADYFDQELVRTLADGDRSLLGSVQ
jgi:hypothetical protein